MRLLLPTLSAALVSLLSVGATQADDQERFPLSAAYKEECGSCHVPYPPQLLPAESWKAIIAGLDRHFGSNASLDAAKATEITGFLGSHAGRPERREGAAAKGGPNLRITESAWFKRKHREGHDGLTASVWKSSAVKTPANCGACHRQAAEGDYSEHGIRIPRTN